MIRHLRFVDIVGDRSFHARRVFANERSSAHDHDFWEAFFVLAGMGRHVCNGQASSLSRGDAWLIRPPDVHALSGDDQFSFINVAWAAGSWEQWLEVAGLCPHEAMVCRRAPELEPSFERMSNVFAAGSARERLHLARFFAELAPHFWPSSSELDPRPAWLRRTLERFEREDGLRGGYPFLREIAPVSPRSLHREWERAFKETPSAWVGNKRLEHAALLLLQTSLSVQEIAARCGFDNVAYFHRVWKQKQGVTPQQFRANARKRD